MARLPVDAILGDPGYGNRYPIRCVTRSSPIERPLQWHRMFRFRLARLFSIVAILAIDLAVFEAGIKMTGLPGPYRLVFYTKELSRFGIYVLWISACFMVIANRNHKAAYTATAIAAIAGFATSLVDAFFQMWTLTTPAMGKQGFDFARYEPKFKVLLVSHCWLGGIGTPGFTAIHNEETTTTKHPSRRVWLIEIVESLAATGSSQSLTARYDFTRRNTSRDQTRSDPGVARTWIQRFDPAFASSH